MRRLSGSHPLWDSDDEDDEQANGAEEDSNDGCSCGCAAARLCQCLSDVLQGCLGPHWECFKSPAELRQAARRAERAKIRKAFRLYMDYKSMI